jgi:hypothetical protein
MIIVVILANLAIALGHGYLAYRLWQLKTQSQQINCGLIKFESQVRAIFHEAPTPINHVAIGTHHLRLTRQQWALYLQQVKLMLKILNWLFGNYRKILPLQK